MAGLSDLTPRESQILQRVLTGRTSRVIAREMSISEKTVEFHLDHIYTKTGARSRILVGIWAVQHGIFVDPREIPS